ncbi:MAG: hypothetical protein EXS37_14310 [Opitutus sp.]|nr:hypothetical protein [Opitutus sp.]
MAGRALAAAGPSSSSARAAWRPTAVTAAQLEREDALSAHAIDEQRDAGFRDARDGVDLAPAARDRDEVGRRGIVHVPDVMAHVLEMPEPPAVAQSIATRQLENRLSP